MKPVSFPESNAVLAKDQPEYTPLPVRRLDDGTTTSKWQLELADLERLGLSYDEHSCGQLPCIFVTQLTFGAPLQPLAVSTELPPDCFRPITEPALHPVDINLPPLRDIPPEAPSIERIENKLAGIAERKGMSGPILWALDPVTKEADGVTVAHFVRLETQHLTAPVDGTRFQTLDPRNDPRLAHLAECFTAIGDRKLASLSQVLPLVHACLAQVQERAVMQAGTARYVSDVLKLVGAACKAL
jgi:hypothetical protein